MIYWLDDAIMRTIVERRAAPAEASLCSCHLCAGQTPRKGSLLVVPPGLGWIMVARIVVALPAWSLREETQQAFNGRANETPCRKCGIPQQYSPGKSKGFTMAQTHSHHYCMHAGQDGECESDDDAHMGDDPEQRAQIATAQQTKL